MSDLGGAEEEVLGLRVDVSSVEDVPDGSTWGNGSLFVESTFSGFEEGDSDSVQ